MKLEAEALMGRSGHEAAWALLEKMYQKHFSAPMPAVLRTPKGKPYFQGAPVYFSLSHTKRHAFCALSDAPVGLDAEELDRQIDPRLAEKILSPEERAQYLQAPDKNRALLTFWVLKEAFFKCSGQGVGGNLKSTSFSLDDPRVTEHSGCLVALVQDPLQEV